MTDPVQIHVVSVMMGPQLKIEGYFEFEDITICINKSGQYLITIRPHRRLHQSRSQDYQQDFGKVSDLFKKIKDHNLSGLLPDMIKKNKTEILKYLL